MTKIGLLLPTREAVIYGDKSGDPRPLVELAVRAEEAGFDSVWAGDSLLARPRADPLTLLSGVATVTSRVELGTAVLLPSLRNPEQLAQAAGTLDAMSGGRFILGIGGGPGTPGVERDHELVGADFRRRSSRSIEVSRRTQALWRGDDDQMYPLPGTPAGPPVWVGGAGPKTLQRTGAYCDGWFAIVPTHQKFVDGWAKVREAAEEAGRSADDITPAIYTTVVVGEKAEAEAALAEHSSLYYGVPHEVIGKQQGSVAGSAGEAMEWIRGFIDAGATHVCIRVGSADIDNQFDQLAGMLDELKG